MACTSQMIEVARTPEVFATTFAESHEAQRYSIPRTMALRVAEARFPIVSESTAMETKKAKSDNRMGKGKPGDDYLDARRVL